MTSLSGESPGDETGARRPDEDADPWQADIPRAAANPVAWGALRILILEDQPSDAELEQRLLRRAGLDFTAVVVDTEETFLHQLDVFGPDVILSDYSLPGFSGEDALKIARERYQQVPFIFLSGALGEEAAVELIRQGATDYVLKDRPARLAAVVRRAVAEAEERTELGRLEARLQQARRLESLGRLAGGVAHDFNNILGIVLNYMSFIGQELAKEPSQIHWQGVRDDIAGVETAVHRAVDLTRQLLTFGRGEVLRPRVLNINDAIIDARQLLVRALGEYIELATVLTGDGGPAFADRGQIEHILVNLAVNARDAMPAGGRLTIETASIEHDEAHADEPAKLPPGSYVRLKVSDTGTGIPKEVIDRVFEPFFTTKPQGAGIGLGLATIYGIVTRAKGAIRIDSESGQGTTVTILLPVTDRGAGPAQEPDRSAGTVVLLVEDEPALRELARRILDRAGYHVLTAAGHDAVALASQHSEIDVLLTDVVMPEMSGQELADRVRAVRPGIPVLFMSPDTQGALSDPGLLKPGFGFLEEPFSRASLLAKLSEVLAIPD
jgi:signal transduction histidine kinase